MRSIAGVVGLVVLVALGGVLAGSRGGSAPPSAKALEASLLAPCCFGGTIDVHDSDISRELRSEIESRVARGESTLSIEADFVSRYGPQIRAMPNPGAFSATMASVMVFIAAAGVSILLLSRRRRGATVGAHDGLAAAPSSSRDADDERLDGELEAMD
ncbi:MAG: cytochrome c-type biogenesis protein CcmH [Polyangiaceae bacterium]